MFSIVLTVRNGIPTLVETIDSIKAQTDQDYEVIIVDDSSSDGTYPYLKSLAWPRLVLLRAPGGNVARAVNMGLGTARGEWIVKVDHDDPMHPQRLEVHRASIVRDPVFDIHAVETVNIHGEGPWTTRPPIPSTLPPGRDVTRQLGIRNPITHSSICYRRNAIERIGGYDENFDLMNDYWTYVRMANAGARICLIPVVAQAVRIHTRQQFSNTARVRYNRAARRVQQAYLTGSLGWPAWIAWTATSPRLAYGLLPLRFRRFVRGRIAARRSARAGR